MQLKKEEEEAKIENKIYLCEEIDLDDVKVSFQKKLSMLSSLHLGGTNKTLIWTLRRDVEGSIPGTGYTIRVLNITITASAIRDRLLSIKQPR